MSFPLKRSQASKKTPIWQKSRSQLDDNKAFGFTEADIEKYKAPIDDEDISEDSDAMDNKSDDENYEDENFD